MYQHQQSFPDINTATTTTATTQTGTATSQNRPGPSFGMTSPSTITAYDERAAAHSTSSFTSAASAYPNSAAAVAGGGMSPSAIVATKSHHNQHHHYSNGDFPDHNQQESYFDYDGLSSSLIDFDQHHEQNYDEDEMDRKPAAIVKSGVDDNNILHSHPYTDHQGPHSKRAKISHDNDGTTTQNRALGMISHQHASPQHNAGVLSTFQGEMGSQNMTTATSFSTGAKRPTSPSNVATTTTTIPNANHKQQSPPPPSFVNLRIAKKFRVKSTNKFCNRNGKVCKIFFGTVVSHQEISPKPGTKIQSIQSYETNNNNVITIDDDNDDNSSTEKQYMWHIVYDDGDEQDLDLEQMIQARSLYESTKGFDINPSRTPKVSTLSDMTEEEYQIFEGEVDDDNDEDYMTSLKKSKKRKSKKKVKPSNLKPPPPSSSTSQPISNGKKDVLTMPNEIYSGPPDERMEGGWPNGWLKKIVARKGGAAAGRGDRYWFSPIHKYKFRSMKEVQRFMGALPRCNGDEQLAWKAIKNNKK